MQHGQLRIRTRSGVHHVQIFLQRRIDRHHRAVLHGGREAPFLRVQHHQRLFVTQHFDEHPLRRVILFRLGVEALKKQSVRPDLHGLAWPHIFL